MAAGMLVAFLCLVDVSPLEVVPNSFGYRLSNPVREVNQQ